MDPNESYLIVTLNDLSHTDPIPRRSFELTAPRWAINIGRATKSGADDLLPDERNAYFESKVMSRYHALLSASPKTKEVFITDVGSMHGTKLETRRLQADIPKIIEDGDVLLFGTEVVRAEVTFPALQLMINYEWVGMEFDSCPPPEFRNRRAKEMITPTPFMHKTPNSFSAEYSDDDEDESGDETENYRQQTPPLSSAKIVEDNMKKSVSILSSNLSDAGSFGSEDHESATDYDEDFDSDEDYQMDEIGNDCLESCCNAVEDEDSEDDNDPALKDREIERSSTLADEQPQETRFSMVAPFSFTPERVIAVTKALFENSHIINDTHAADLQHHSEVCSGRPLDDSLKVPPWSLGKRRNEELSASGVSHPLGHGTEVRPPSPSDAAMVKPVQAVRAPPFSSNTLQPPAHPEFAKPPDYSSTSWATCNSTQWKPLDSVSTPHHFYDASKTEVLDGVQPQNLQSSSSTYFGTDATQNAHEATNVITDDAELAESLFPSYQALPEQRKPSSSSRISLDTILNTSPQAAVVAQQVKNFPKRKAEEMEDPEEDEVVVEFEGFEKLSSTQSLSDFEKTKLNNTPHATDLQADFSLPNRSAQLPTKGTIVQRPTKKIKASHEPLAGRQRSVRLVSGTAIKYVATAFAGVALGAIGTVFGLAALPPGLFE